MLRRQGSKGLQRKESSSSSESSRSSDDEWAKKLPPPVSTLLKTSYSSTACASSSAKCSIADVSASSPSTNAAAGILLSDNDYVVVRCAVNRGQKKSHTFFVGCILSITGAEYLIQCMRRHDESTSIFVYPSADDISIYNKDDIIEVLGTPKCVRGIYHFHNSLIHYLPYLR
jgi:hypothetical protein